jgi:hypothetical protein
VKKTVVHPLSNKNFVEIVGWSTEPFLYFLYSPCPQGRRGKEESFIVIPLESIVVSPVQSIQIDRDERVFSKEGKKNMSLLSLAFALYSLVSGESQKVKGWHIMQSGRK